MPCSFVLGLNNITKVDPRLRIEQGYILEALDVPFIAREPLEIDSQMLVAID